MSFLNKLVTFIQDVAESSAQAANERANEIRKAKEKLADKDDQELIKIIKDDRFFGSSNIEKSVALGMLRERGYNPMTLEND